MNLKIKAAIQFFCLAMVLAITALSAFSHESQANVETLLVACPVGGGNCAADPKTGREYDFPAGSLR